MLSANKLFKLFILFVRTSLNSLNAHLSRNIRKYHHKLRISIAKKLDSQCKISAADTVGPAAANSFKLVQISTNSV